VDSFHDGATDVRGLLLRDSHALVVAADDGGRVVGTLIVGWDGWRGNLYRMAVATASRRQGIAAALVAEAERRLTDAGCRRISAGATCEPPRSASQLGHVSLRRAGRACYVAQFVAGSGRGGPR
jgi:GNAT superfamily N-acetyltransferase